MRLVLLGLVLMLGLPPLPGQASKSSADSLYNEAMAAAQKNDFVEAEFWLRELRAKYPQDQRWEMSLIGVLEARGRFDDALRLARELQPRYEKTPTVYMQKGRLLMQLDRPQEALTEFQSALKFSTNSATSASLYNMIGDAYRSLERYDQALIALRKAKDLTGQPSVLLALTLGEKGLDAEEIQEYRAVLRQNPNSVVALNNLAYAYSERNENLSEALAMVQRAVDASPGNSYYLDTLGWVYFKLRRYDEAEENMIEALMAEGGNEETLREHLAAVMDARGQWTPDRRTLRGLLETAAKPNEIAKMKALLSKIRQQ